MLSSTNSSLRVMSTSSCDGRMLPHLAGGHRDGVAFAVLYAFESHQPFAGVEGGCAQPFGGQAEHLLHHIIAHGSPAAQTVAPLLGVGGVTPEHIGQNAEEQRRVAGHSRHFGEPLRVPVEHGGKTAEGVYQRVRYLVGVAHRNEMEKNVLQNLVVAESGNTVLLDFLPHSVAVTVVCSHTRARPLIL